MESVEAIVAHILALSERPEEVSHLHSLLKQAEDALQAHAGNLLPFLGQLDPSKHSLGYLYLLFVHYGPGGSGVRPASPRDKGAIVQYQRLPTLIR